MHILPSEGSIHYIMMISADMRVYCRPLTHLVVFWKSDRHRFGETDDASSRRRTTQPDRSRKSQLWRCTPARNRHLQSKVQILCRKPSCPWTNCSKSHSLRWPQAAGHSPGNCCKHIWYGLMSLKMTFKVSFKIWYAVLLSQTFTDIFFKNSIYGLHTAWVCHKMISMTLCIALHSRCLAGISIISGVGSVDGTWSSSKRSRPDCTVRVVTRRSTCHKMGISNSTRNFDVPWMTTNSFTARPVLKAK